MGARCEARPARASYGARARNIQKWGPFREKRRVWRVFHLSKRRGHHLGSLLRHGCRDASGAGERHASAVILLRQECA